MTVASAGGARGVDEGGQWWAGASVRCIVAGRSVSKERG